jgi:hypothetical protein
LELVEVMKNYKATYLYRDKNDNLQGVEFHFTASSKTQAFKTARLHAKQNNYRFVDLYDSNNKWIQR